MSSAGSTGIIAFVSPRLTSPFSVAITAAAEEAAYSNKKYHRGIVPFSTWNMPEEKDALLLELLESRRADAVVLITTYPSKHMIDEYKKAGIPLIVIEYSIMGTHCIMLDNFEGGNMAGEYLAGKYGASTAIVVGPVKPQAGIDVHPAAIDRLKGFRSALSVEDIGLRDEMIRQVYTYSREEGRQIMNDFIKEKNIPRSIFCAAGDETAVGIIEAAAAHGIKMPEELAIVGYDDIEIAALITPALTTIKQPLAEIGRLAYDAAIAAIGGSAQEPAQIIVKPELIIRKSA